MEAMKKNSINLLELINKYYSKVELLLIETKARLEETIHFITTTEIVPNDYFDNNNNICNNDREIMYKDFDNVYVIFNDIKKSTNIIRYCEKHNLICLYIGYIKYSSELLAEILDYFNGKMIEITGDGNYSIIENLNEKSLNSLINNNIDELIDELLNLKFYFLKNHILKLFLYDKYNKNENKLENLLYIVFYIFNSKINKLLEFYNYDINFFTRVSCKYGNCKITRFKIGNYLLQDKLIGDIVNKAAHKAQGKK